MTTYIPDEHGHEEEGIVTFLARFNDWNGFSGETRYEFIYVSQSPHSLDSALATARFKSDCGFQLITTPVTAVTLQKRRLWDNARKKGLKAIDASGLEFTLEWPRCDKCGPKLREERWDDDMDNYQGGYRVFYTCRCSD